MKLKPIGGKILVEPIEQSDKTASGLFIPEQSKQKPQEGIVRDVGAGARDETGKLIPFNVTIGDKVLFAKYGGVDVKYDNKDYKLLFEDEILAILS